MNILLAETTKADGKNAGNKARSDVQSILESINFKHINLYKSGYGKIHIIITTFFALVKAFLEIKKGECLVIEHPYSYPYECLLSRYAKFLQGIKHCQTVLIVHDLNSIRFGKISIKKEIALLNNYAYIICHNEIMEGFLLDNLCTSKIIKLGLFDYIVEDKKRVPYDCDKNTLVIAGNLAKTKCGYLYDIPKDIKLNINLYGVGADEQALSSRIHYKGAYSPEELPDVLVGRFGLVWDGSSVDCGKDIVGNYLRYNNPHKLSLYIASGIPVIVWNESAIASYIVKSKLGFTIHNLLEISSVMNKITDSQYADLLAHVEIERQELINGNHLKLAIEKIITKEN